jgi:hypothetical protein
MLAIQGITDPLGDPLADGRIVSVPVNIHT